MAHAQTQTDAGKKQGKLNIIRGLARDDGGKYSPVQDLGKIMSKAKVIGSYFPIYSIPRFLRVNASERNYMNYV